MTAVTENQVAEALAQVTVPDLGDNVIALGLISGIVVKDGMVHIMVETTGERADIMEEVRKECEKLAAELCLSHRFESWLFHSGRCDHIVDRRNNCKLSGDQCC